MNRYLLLRDNKEAGPFTAAELSQKGLKAYDLIWVIDKSAAWRYPGEIEELQSFAPVVEEQPFDRFFRKEEPAEYTYLEKAARAQRAATEKSQQHYTPPPNRQPAAPPPARKPEPVADRKIFVTLPGGGNTPDTPPPAQKEATPVADTRRFEPVPIDQPAPVTTPPQPAAIEPVRETPAPVYKAPHQYGYRQLPAAWRMGIAACLLLGGVLIGLWINRSPQKMGQQTPPASQTAFVNTPVAENTTELASADQSEDMTNPANEVPPSSPVSHTPPTNNTNTVKENTPQPPVNTPPAVTKEADTETAGEPAPKAVMPPHQVDSAALHNIESLVAVAASDYKTGLLGGISQLALTVSNNSLYQLDVVEVEVRYLGPEKRVVSTQTVKFANVPAGQQLTLDVPKSHRGVTVDYAIKRIHSKALGLAKAGF